MAGLEYYRRKTGDEKWGCIQEPEQLEETLGNLGITKDKEIILIGETLDGWGDDARLLWELRAGYEDDEDGRWRMEGVERQWNQDTVPRIQTGTGRSKKSMKLIIPM